jgi:hypothetical protein
MTQPTTTTMRRQLLKANTLGVFAGVLPLYHRHSYRKTAAKCVTLWGGRTPYPVRRTGSEFNQLALP